MIVPDSVAEFFSGAGGINVMVSPRFLKQHTGSSRVYLPSYDIYHGGKDRNGKIVYTRYRILGKESVHNTIQGLLEIHIIEGYGIKSVDGAEVHKLIRPSDARKLMTEGTMSIKRNSAIILESGILVRLEDVENFCDLPLIQRSRLFKFETHVTVEKRQHYKVVRGTENWAHVKRGALAREMERSVHKLLLPYYRKYRSCDSGEQKDIFFRTFMEDLLTVCKAHHGNFAGGSDFMKIVEETMSNGSKRKEPCLLNETRPRKKWGGVPTIKVLSEKRRESSSESIYPADTVEGKVKQALKNVSRTKIASIVF